MSSRKGRVSEAPVVDIPGLTAQLRAQLRNYTALTGTVNSSLKDVNQMHTELDEDMKPINLVKGRLDRAYDELGRSAEDEIKRIDQAIETLDLLVAMQKEADAVGNAQAAGAKKRGPYMTKAKKEASSTAPSPAASAPSPLPHPSPVGGSFVPLSRSGSSKGPLPPPTFSAPSPAASTHSTGTAAPRKMTAKNRKQLLSEQLPLQPGRKIAYRQTGKPAPGEPKTEEWILAEILECLDPEKNKYRVLDVDYEPKPGGDMDGGKYIANLRSIIPLPDATRQPLHEFPSGTSVMALYPETTSFYKAFIQSGPERQEKEREKGKKKKDKEDGDLVYSVIFDEDGDVVRKVSVALVLEIP